MRCFAWAFAVIVALGVLEAPAAAHPLGNFTINHLAKISLHRHEAIIRYILDIAEIPTFQIMAERGIDPSRPAQRLKDWGESETGVISANLIVEADGQRLRLKPTVANVSTRLGAGGLPTLYFVDTFRAAYPRQTPPKRLDVIDDNYSGRIGWKDIIVAPQTEPTKELRAYPNALLGSPKAVTAVSLTLAPDAHALRVATDNPMVLALAGSPSQARSNVLSDRLARGSSDLVVAMLTLLIAIGLGALHALEPGHGKTLLAVSLVGARATPMQAVLLALSLTLAHTAGVVALGVALLAFAQFIVPENVYPWVALGSGALVVILGASALGRYVRHQRGAAHDHGDGHGHQGSSGHVHGRSDHDHRLLDSQDGRLSFRSVILVAMSGNIAPCPAALVVLLTALTLHRVGYGLLVVVAFSIGLATALTALGIVFVRGASWLSERRGFDRIARHAPLLTAVVISSIGSVMVAKAAASLVAVSFWAVATLVVTAIVGYALTPGHDHPAMSRREAT